MINTIRYAGKATVKKDGKQTLIQIPPSSALASSGPTLPVTITHPRITQEKFKQAGKIIESINVTALIDTGASLTIITPDVVRKLGLVQTGVQKISSVQDEQVQPVYFGFVIFPWGVAKEIPVVSCPLKGYKCLIGRDILRHWHFTYHGVDGSVVICD